MFASSKMSSPPKDQKGVNYTFTCLLIVSYNLFNNCVKFGHIQDGLNTLNGISSTITEHLYCIKYFNKHLATFCGSTSS